MSESRESTAQFLERMQRWTDDLSSRWKAASDELDSKLEQLRTLQLYLQQLAQARHERIVATSSLLSKYRLGEPEEPSGAEASLSR